MKKTIEFSKVPKVSRAKWLSDFHIHKSQMSKWQRLADGEWLNHTQKELSSLKNRERGKGLYHEQEVKLHNMYTQRRSLGYKVSYKWISSRMLNICTKDKPGGKDFLNYSGFKSSWVRRWCKRWHVSCQRRTNRKSVHIYNRLHLIEKYHKQLIFDLQNPENFKFPNNWFSKSWYVENHREPSPNEDDLENKDALVLSDSETSVSDTE